MRRYRSPYGSPPRCYGDRRRSSTRRRHDGNHEQNNQTLLVQNFHHHFRPEDLKVPFETFGKIQDLSLPKNFFYGKRTAFVQFVDPYDASKAQSYMDGIAYGGRKIAVTSTSERIRLKKFKRAGHRLPSSDGSCGSFFYGEEDLPVTSHSCSHRRPSTDGTHKWSRSCPAMQRLGDSEHTRSLKFYRQRRHVDFLLSQVGGNDSQYVDYDSICSFSWKQVKGALSSLKSEVFVVGTQSSLKSKISYH